MAPGTGEQQMRTWKAALRWVTLIPVALAGGLLGRAAFVLVTRLGFMLGGWVQPDSQEFEVMSWLYGLAGDALAGGLVVWIASRWAPSRRLGAATIVCTLVCLLGGVSFFGALRITYDASLLIGSVATLVGALLGLGYVVGEQWGERDWLEQYLAAGWHGVGQMGHLIVSGIATLPLWWWVADPVGEWKRCFADAAVWWWPIVGGMWMWRVAWAGVWAFVVAFVLVLLLLLAVKLPFILMWRLSVRRRDAPLGATGDADEYGLTALHRAAERGDIAEVRRLLAAGADVNAAGAMDGCTPLHLAAEHEAMAAFLIRNGADVKARAVFGDTPLHLAARENNVAVARLLLNRGAEVDAADGFGQTPLHGAARRGSIDVARLLLERGADPNATDHRGQTPLANVEGSDELVTLLLSCGASDLDHVLPADVNAPGPDGKTWLHLAAADGNVTRVEWLLAKGSRLEARDANGDTPLHLAALLGRDEVISLLIDKGADVNTHDCNGTTPLYAAGMRADPSTLELLIAHGADVNAPSESGQTPLHRVVRLGHVRSIELLLLSGGDANARDSDGLTPLALAMALGDDAVLDVFARHGVIEGS